MSGSVRVRLARPRQSHVWRNYAKTQRDKKLAAREFLSDSQVRAIRKAVFPAEQEAHRAGAHRLLVEAIEAQAQKYGVQLATIVAVTRQ